MKKAAKQETSLGDAVEMVKAEIDKQTKYYEKIASTDNQTPVMLDGVTTTGYNCGVMVDPKEVAKVFLDYDYPACLVLDNEPSSDMWYTLARKLGLDEVCGVDIPIKEEQ